MFSVGSPHGVIAPFAIVLRYQESLFIPSCTGFKASSYLSIWVRRPILWFDNDIVITVLGLRFAEATRLASLIPLNDTGQKAVVLVSSDSEYHA